MRKLMRDLTPGELIVPDSDHPNDVQTVESITINKQGVRVYTANGKALTTQPVSLESVIEVADPAPRIIASWCATESTWYINVDTSQRPGIRMNLSMNDRVVYDGQDNVASGSGEIVLRIRQHWVRLWQVLASEAVQANRALIPFNVNSKAIETFGRRRFAAGVHALLRFMDTGEANPELEKILELAVDEKRPAA